MTSENTIRTANRESLRLLIAFLDKNPNIPPPKTINRDQYEYNAHSQFEFLAVMMTFALAKDTCAEEGGFRVSDTIFDTDVTPAGDYRLSAKIRIHTSTYSIRFLVSHVVDSATVTGLHIVSL